ncbi:MAG: hypothetical protein JXA11_12705 [Phycisphaerae bacterium]|nr:hypothetical protein [Phycisphaerae bacterium]
MARTSPPESVPSDNVVAPGREKPYSIHDETAKWNGSADALGGSARAIRVPGRRVAPTAVRCGRLSGKPRAVRPNVEEYPWQL